MNRLHKALQEAGHRPLLGAAMYFYDPIFLEVAAQLGFNVIWIEMEHAPITFAEAADLCRMAAGSGMLTMIRIPDTRRESVLKAAECGPDIIDVPMANDPEQLRELIKYAKFAPEGTRGFFSVSRAVNYGIVESVPNMQQQLNRELCLMAQVETLEAVERIEELCAVPGVDIFIGPSDLAASLGVPGQTAHPKVMEAAQRERSILQEKEGRGLRLPARRMNLSIGCGWGSICCSVPTTLPVSRSGRALLSGKRKKRLRRSRVVRKVKISGDAVLKFHSQPILGAPYLDAFFASRCGIPQLSTNL